MLAATAVGAVAAVAVAVLQPDPWASTPLDERGWKACDDAAGRLAGTGRGAELSTRKRVELATNTNWQAHRSDLREVRGAGRWLDAVSVASDPAWLAGVAGFTGMCADNGYPPS